MLVANPTSQKPIYKLAMPCETNELSLHQAAYLRSVFIFQAKKTMGIKILGV